MLLITIHLGLTGIGRPAPQVVVNVYDIHILCHLLCHLTPLVSRTIIILFRDRFRSKDAVRHIEAL